MVISGSLEWTCICSAQFANLHNFEIALRKLEIAKICKPNSKIVQPSLRNFKIAQPSLRTFEIVQPSLRDYEIALRKLEIVKFRSTISKIDVYSNVKPTCTFP